ncbi:PQQ-binding-like beta-propeller repeat protein [Verrucomicrobiota bacterium]
MKRIICCILICAVFLSFAEAGEDILKASGVKGGPARIVTQSVSGGLVVCVGAENPEFIAGLRTDENYLVHCLDTDQKKVDSARKYIQGKGLYGKVSVDKFDGKHLPYADNLVNLVVVTGYKLQVTEEEIERVLAPRGVVLIKGNLKPRNKSGAKAPETCNLKPQSPSGLKGWTMFTKPVPKEIDDWTHFMHGADGNAVAKDSKVGLPQRLQWWTGPIWARHHNTIQGTEAAVSANGRIFSLFDEAPASGGGGLPDKWVLVARDAFNGLFLWKKSAKTLGWEAWATKATVGRYSEPKQIHRRLVAVGDRVYVTLGMDVPVTALDAATGEVIRTYEKTEFTSEIVYDSGILVLALRNKKSDPKGEEKPGADSGNRVMAIQADTGKILWVTKSYMGSGELYPKYQPLQDLKITVGEKKIFFLAEKNVVCLDLNTGKELWQASRAITMAPKKEETRRGVKQNDYHSTLMWNDGILYLLQPHVLQSAYAPGYNPATLLAMSAESGKLLWSSERGHMGFGTQSALFIARDLLWVHDKSTGKGDATFVALDPKTGEQKRLIPSQDLMRVPGFHPRCYPEKATEDIFWTSMGGRPLQAIDLNDGDYANLPWLKTACRLGVLPCNGLLYILPHPCTCQNHVRLNGFLSVSSADVKLNATASRLLKGPSYGKNPKSAIRNPQSNWPMYRNDIKRSGYTKSAVSLPLKSKWTKSLGGKLSASIIVDGKLFVAASDAHTVYALNAETGETLWSFVAGGIVDSPPAFYKGLLLFGSKDGRVYCLNASDGKLVWRFRAAPEERRIAVFGQLSSPWPVNGSVLIKDDVAYVAAGISSYLDGGIYIYALDPLTGKVVKENVINTTGLKKPEYPPAPGAQADILVSDGEFVYMRHTKLDFDATSWSLRGDKGSKKEEDVELSGKYLFSSKGMLDESWFHRTGWMYGETRQNGIVRIEEKLPAEMMKNFGQLIVFDDSLVYSFKVFGNWSRSGGQFDPRPGGKNKIGLYANNVDSGKTEWIVKVPLYGKAMVLADDVLFVAGSPMVVEDEDPWAAVEDRKGGARLMAYSKKDGKLLFETELAAPPALDGMSVAGGKLFVSLKNGTVVCFE